MGHPDQLPDLTAVVIFNPGDLTSDTPGNCSTETRRGRRVRVKPHWGRHLNRAPALGAGWKEKVRRLL
jgi:hypothetical protein